MIFFFDCFLLLCLLWLVLLFVLVLVLVVCVSIGGLEFKVMLFDVDSLQIQCILVNFGLSQLGWLFIDWWCVLGDFQFDVLIVEGLQCNLGLDVVDVCLCQVCVQIGIVCVDCLLSVFVFGGYIGVCLFELMVGDEFGGSYVGSGQVYFSVSYGIDFWGGKCVVWEVVVDSGYVVVVDVQVVCLNFLVVIVEVYVQLGYVWQLYDVVSEELVWVQKILDLICQWCVVGIDSDLQICQVEVCILVVQQQWQVVQQQIDEVCIVLVVLVGQGLDCGLQIECLQVFNLFVLQFLGVLFSELFGCCLDIVVVCWCVEVVQCGIYVVKVQFYFSLNFIVFGGVVFSEVD